MVEIISISVNRGGGKEDYTYPDATTGTYASCFDPDKVHKYSK